MLKNEGGHTKLLNLLERLTHFFKTQFLPHTLYFHVCTNVNENIVAPISHSLEKYTESGDLRLLLMIVL